MIALLLLLASAEPAGVAPAPCAWPIPAGLAIAATGALSLGAGGIVGAVAISTNAQANASLVQLDAVALDRAAREQALVATSLSIFGAALVVGGAATAGVGLALE